MAHTVTLKEYGKGEPKQFRPMTLVEAKALHYGQHIWILSNQNDARRVKVNGAPKVWKRNPGRVEVPFKYGLYEYDRWDETKLDRMLFPVITIEQETA